MVPGACVWLHDHGKKYGEMDYWQDILLNDVYGLENTSQYNGKMEESYSWEWCVRNAKCFNGTRYQKHGLCHKVEGSGMSSYLMSCTMTATCTDSWLCAHDHPTLALVQSQPQLSHTGSGTTPRAAISSTWAEISGKVGNDWWTAYQQGCLPHSLTSLYHTMFHVTHVYKLGVGGTIQVPQSVNQTWLMLQDPSLPLLEAWRPKALASRGSGNWRANTSHFALTPPHTAS